MSLKDILGEARAEALLDDLGDAYEQLKRLGWKEQRPWKEFFSVFKPPEWTAKGVEQRVATNFLYFRSNYIMLFGTVVVSSIIFAPLLLATLLTVFAINVYVFVLHKGSIRVGDHELSFRDKAMASVVASVFIMSLTGALTQLLWAVIIGLSVCLVHMVFRPRNVHSKMNRHYEEWKMAGFSLGYIGTEAKPSDDDLENPDDVAAGEDVVGVPTASSRLTAATAGNVRQRGKKGD